jgi:hypothetical protein
MAYVHGFSCHRVHLQAMESFKVRLDFGSDTALANAINNYGALPDLFQSLDNVSKLKGQAFAGQLATIFLAGFVAEIKLQEDEGMQAPICNKDHKKHFQLSNIGLFLERESKVNITSFYETAVKDIKRLICFPPIWKAIHYLRKELQERTRMNKEDIEQVFAEIGFDNWTK